MRNAKFQHLSRKLLPITFIACLFSVNGFTQIPNSQKLSPREIAQRTLPSVVLLIMQNSRDETGKTGSGFFVTSDIVATNYHVIKDTDKGVVKIVGQEKLYDIVGVVGLDEKNDLALLKVSGIAGRSLVLDTDDATAIGDEVFAIGNPQGLEGTFSQGIVSSLRNTKSRNLIQITASISQGSSGGAVLNDHGEVVGIAVGAIESGQSLNFAIPVSKLRFLIANRSRLIGLSVDSITTKDKQNAKTSTQSPPPNKRIPVSPAPTRASRLQFKTPDWTEENLRGEVKSIFESAFTPKRKFDVFELGEPVATRTNRYNSDGYLDKSEETIYSESGLSISNSRFAYRADQLLGRTVGFPYAFETVNVFDYQKGLVKVVTYGKCPSCSEFQQKSEDLTRYERDIVSSYRYDGGLLNKIVTERRQDGQTIMTTYGSEGEPSRKKVISKVGEVKEFMWDNPGKWSTYKVTSNMGTQIQVVTTDTCYEEDKSYDCVETETLDKNSKLIVARTHLSADTDVYKYEYEFDAIGNWTKKTELHQVAKFGKKFFEPSFVWIRRISYF